MNEDSAISVTLSHGAIVAEEQGACMQNQFICCEAPDKHKLLLVLQGEAVILKPSFTFLALF